MDISIETKQPSNSRINICPKKRGTIKNLSFPVLGGIKERNSENLIKFSLGALGKIRKKWLKKNNAL
ncbi:MAG: hypothetical protein DK304_000688 [Chloroflexi bacterium]|jgi:hypothetical protein|nr:MAG: hypothetical protein DK304_000688 [Chloroflexota bacterium]